MLPPDDERGAINAELRRLRAKQNEVKDRDIKKALGLSIEAFEEKLAKLEASAPKETEAARVDPASARAEIEADLKRLRVKQSAVGDRDMEAALGLQIEALQAKLSGLQEVTPPEPELPPAPSTPEQEAAADKLVQQARVEKLRGNTKGAADLLAQASHTAPGSALVLELLGDELSEQRKFAEAIEAYDKARKLDEKNVNVDKKHANLVFQSRAAAAGALMALGDREALASNSKRAMLLSVFVPGLGQIVLAQYTKGAVLFGIWFSMILWLLIGHKDLEGLLHSAAMSLGWKATHGLTDYNITIVIPIVVALIVWLMSIWGCKTPGNDINMMMGGPPSSATKPKVERPTPPVNLPFE